jgi:hypothetical protein
MEVEVNYHVYKRLRLRPIHCQISPIHTHPLCFLKINFKITYNLRLVYQSSPAKILCEFLTFFMCVAFIVIIIFSEKQSSTVQQDSCVVGCDAI